MPCRIKYEKHAADRCIERGISRAELKEAVQRGPTSKSIILGNNKSKDFINYKIYEVICFCIPCLKRVKTIYLKKK